MKWIDSIVYDMFILMHNDINNDVSLCWFEADFEDRLILKLGCRPLSDVLGIQRSNGSGKSGTKRPNSKYIQVLSPIPNQRKFFHVGASNSTTYCWFGQVSFTPQVHKQSRISKKSWIATVITKSCAIYPLSRHHHQSGDYSRNTFQISV